MDTRLLQELRARAQSLTDWVIGIRRDLHVHPELGNQEHRTAALVVSHLRRLGLEVCAGVAGTGVVAVLRGRPSGRTIALRADMDALPIDEEGERSYRSCVPGVMHACGHDGHVAMALGAAAVLSRLRPHLNGNVTFLFQPAEETYGGSSEMIAAGCLTTAPAVDAVFGLHLWPDGPPGEVRVRRGAVMASNDVVRIVVHGTGGHAGEPQGCLDPVPVAAHIITALQTMVTRGFDARNPVILTITYLQAGSAFNVIPAEVALAGTVRTVDPAVRHAMPGRIEQVVTHTAQAFGATADSVYVRGSGVVVNDAAFTDWLMETLRRTRGDHAVREMLQPVMGAEDFGSYLERVPGAFAFLGARPSHQAAHPCHHPRFDIDEQALPIGVEVLSTVALAYLGRP